MTVDIVSVCFIGTMTMEDLLLLEDGVWAVVKRIYLLVSFPMGRPIGTRLSLVIVIE